MPPQIRFHIAPQSSPAHVGMIADSLTIAALWLVLAGGVMREFLGQTEVLSFGFYTFHTVDPGVILAALATLAHMSRGRFEWHLYSVPILSMALLIAINFLRGTAADFGMALLWGRANGGFASLLMLALVMRPIPLVMQAIRNALILASILLGALVVLRLATHPSLFMTLDVSDYMVNDGGRPLTAQGTFLLVLTSVMLTSDFLRRRFVIDRLTVAVIVLPLLILLTEQGTANIAEICALGTVFFVQRGQSKAGRILFGGMLVIGFLGLLAMLLPEVMGSTYALQRTNNLSTRQEVWFSLMELWHSLPIMTQLFGFAAGEQPPLLVFLSGAYGYWEHGIHSMYYGALPMMGYAGALAYIALLAVLLWGTLLGSLRRGGAFPAFPLACCVATAIISYSYEIRNDAVIGLFLAIWWLRAYPAPHERIGHPARGEDKGGL